ncbi:MAG: universal stress protein [Rudaea sp.]
MFKHILLPADGSKLSEKSIRQGIRFAKACAAKVVALDVIPRIALGQYEEEAIDQVDGYLDFVNQGSARRGCRVRGCIRSGRQAVQGNCQVGGKKVVI